MAASDDSDIQNTLPPLRVLEEDGIHVGWQRHSPISSLSVSSDPLPEHLWNSMFKSCGGCCCLFNFLPFQTEKPVDQEEVVVSALTQSRRFGFALKIGPCNLPCFMSLCARGGNLCEFQGGHSWICNLWCFPCNPVFCLMCDPIWCLLFAYHRGCSYNWISCADEEVCWYHDVAVSLFTD